MTAATARILVGTAGFSYPDWRGRVYPMPRPRGFDELRYLARFVDVVEINNTFYRPPDAAHCERWLQCVEDRPDFRFTAKLYRGFTHQRPAQWSEPELRQFVAGIEPLRASGRLGAVLAQFPHWFAADPQARDHLQRIADAFAAFPIVVEVRHRSFLAPNVLRALESMRLSFCGADQPLGRDSMPPLPLRTGDIGYFRLHGRNAKAWFDAGASRDAKYDYLYDDAELADLAELMRRMAVGSEQTYVIANNHFLGKALVNALELKAGFAGRPLELPPALLAAYPRLQSIGVAAP